jgi:hypothetical protein
LPQTGEADPATMRAMGFTATRSMEIAQAASPSGSAPLAWRGSGTWTLLISTLGAAGLLYLAMRAKRNR